MAAVALGGEIKKDLAVMVMGVIGSLALRHGDSVALVYGDGASSLTLPARGTESHLEQVLRQVDAAALGNGPSELCARLEYVASHYKQRLLLVVMADEVEADERLSRVLRRLRAQHEILWVQLADAALAGPGAVHGAGLDVAGLETVLTLLAQDPGLANSYLHATAARAQALADVLTANGIAATNIGSTSEVMTKVFALLESHRRAH